jgi:hypothetical protein
MDGLIEQLKETARGIEKRREDLKEAGYNIGRAIRILENENDLVRVEIQEPRLDPAAIEAVKKLAEDAEEPIETEKNETARWDDPPEKTEESTAQPHTEPLLDDPISVKGRKRKTMYKNLTTSSSIVNCLSRAGQPIPATKVWEMLNAGGKEISLATTRASLSSMRVSLKCEKIKVDTERGPAKVTHYSLLPVSELV